MALSIVAAKDHLAEEPEEIGKFLYDFRAAFTNYACYYRFDSYRDTCLEPDQVPAIKAFSDSVIEWLAEHCAEENSVIRQYGVSFKKIRRFAVDLGHVCDTAMEYGYRVMGIGD